MPLESEEQKLEHALTGWTVIGIEPANLDEQIFAIVAQKGNTIKRVVISATDLGWWVDKVEAEK